jgi:hypothetical protein
MAGSSLPVHVAGSYLSERPETGDPPQWLDAGTNVPAVAFHYHLAAEPERVTLTVKDAEGAVIKVLSSDELEKGDSGPQLPKAAGSARVVWDGKYPGATRIKNAATEWSTCAPLAPPGTYTVTLEAGDYRETRSFRLLPPPNVATPEADYKAQFALLMRVRDDVSRIHAAFNRMTALAEEVTVWERRIAGHDREVWLKEALERVRDGAAAVRDALVQWRLDNFQDSINFPPRLNAQVAHLFQVVASADAKPTSQTHTALEALERRMETELKHADDLMAEEMAEFNRRAHEANLPALTPS